MTAPSTQYVATREIQDAIKGHEEEVLAALGVNWQQSKGHITCPYPDHGGENDWRWDAKKAKAYCTCSRGDSIFDVAMKCEGIDFEAAKVRTATILGRQDLIRTRDEGQRFQATDAASLIAPPVEARDDGLAAAYLSNRLNVAPGSVFLPNTPVAGWRALTYFDPPAGKGGKPKPVGDHPCAVFGTVGLDGKRHAHRIYVAPGGAGKAALGRNSEGQLRDPKKSARKGPGDNTAGRAVLWGDPAVAPWIILAEGIETAAAIAFTFRAEIERGEAVVAAAITAGGVEAFRPWPATQRVTVAADRDEAPKPDGRVATRRGEQAARLFGVRTHRSVDVTIALPGAPGASVDWLDIFLQEQSAAVRVGIVSAVPYEPTAAEIEQAEGENQQALELADIIRTYPLPTLHTLSLVYEHTATGKVKVHKKSTRDGAETLVPVATPFGVPARLRYVDQANSYGLRVVVQEMSGKPRILDIDRANLSKMGGSDIKGLLFSAGLRVEDDGEQIAVQCLKGADPEVEILVVRKPGWHQIEGWADRIFVCPGGPVLGVKDLASVELAVSARISSAIARKGSLEGWSNAIAAAASAEGCEHWILGIIASFAGALISLADLDSCGISFSGMSSAGKTTAQRLAASAWSKPSSHKESLFQSAKATVNGLEMSAARANGTVLVLDELAHISGKELGRMIYTLAGGTGKKRMTAEASMRESYTWATFMVLSSERSLEEMVRSDGGEWTAGMAVRVVDIDVTNVNRKVPKSIIEMIESVAQHYGHAGPAFVERLIAEGVHQKVEELKRGIDALAAGFAGDADSVVTRSARPFAILQMAGEMARTFDLLPEGVNVAKATKWAWDRFQQSSDATALDPKAQALGKIRTWLAERWGSSVRNVEDDHPNREVLAWFDNEHVYIPDHRIVEAAGRVLKEQEIIKALDEAGFIAKRKSKDVRHVDYIPKIGRGVKAYALRRSEFGRPYDANSDYPFKTYMGGRA